MTATLVLTNGRFYTMDPALPRVTAAAVRGDRIVALGRDDELKALLARDGEWVDLEGRCVTPGLVDAHVHFESFAIYRRRVNLDGARTLDDALCRIAAFLEAEEAPDAETWLQGRGWSQARWPDRAFPTSAQLDRVTGPRPACLRHHSGHAAWVNTRALTIAGITAATPDPPGGQIQRDGDGRPTGILFEDAMQLVTDHIPPPTLPETVAAMRGAQAHCWRVGLTGLHDFDGRSCFRALQIMRQEQELGLRVVKNIPVRRLEHAIGVGLRSGFGDRWLRIGGVKIFADGALGPRTAAMLTPYENEPDNYGIVVTDKEDMYTYASRASAHGLSVTVHAIGDRANHDILDVYAAVRAEELTRLSGGRDDAFERAPSYAHPRFLRHRIEHVQVLHPDDLPRLAQLNVIASMQPIHATSDMEMADRYWGERARLGYAWRSIHDSGATLVFGSDAPIESIDPLPGIHAAVTRRRADGTPGPAGWRPEQKVSVHTAVHAFTTAAATTSGQEIHAGSITPGKFADFTIFERDIFTMPPDELLEAGIAGTIVGGQFRFRSW